MANYTLSIPHDKEVDELIDGCENELLKHLRELFKKLPGVNYKEHTWEDNILVLSVEFGSKIIKSEVHFTEEHIISNTKLPLALRVLASRFESMIINFAKRKLASR